MTNNDTGYFKIWRDLFKKPIWLNSTSDQRSILLAILYLANWKENTWEWKGKPYSCAPGEFISSYANIANAAGKGVTTQKVRTAIKRFKNFNFLTDQTTHGYQDGIKIIVNNWENYQNETNRPVNTSLTDNQQTVRDCVIRTSTHGASRQSNRQAVGGIGKFKADS